MTRQAFPVFTCDVAVATSSAERPVSLDGVDTTNLASGHFAVVTTGSTATLYRLDRSSSAAADGSTVIAPLAGTGRWIEWTGDGSDPTALTQTEWHINADTGDDDNDGSAAAPLASWAELRRRYGTNPILPQSVEVFIESDLDEVLFFDGVPQLADDVVFRVTGGVRSVLASGTLTAVTPQDRGTQTPMQLDDTGLDAFVDRRIRFTDGAAAGATCWAFRSPGADLLDCVQSVTYDTSVNPLPVSGSAVTPSGGDAYVVEELWRVGGVALHFNRLGTHTAVASEEAAAVLDSVDVFDSDSVFAMSSGVDVPLLVRSRVGSGTVEPKTNFGAISSFLFSTTHLGEVETFDACLLKSNVSTLFFRGGVHVVAQGDTIAANGTLILIESWAQLTAFAVFDSNADGVQVAGLSNVSVIGPVWGDGSTGTGWRINAGGVVSYETGSQPTLTGDAGDTTIAGAVVAYGAIPSFNTTTASGMVENVS